MTYNSVIKCQECGCNLVCMYEDVEINVTLNACSECGSTWRVRWADGRAIEVMRYFFG